MLGDDDLCLLISKFQRVYHNRQRKKNPGCYNCGDLNHFIADCPKKSGGGQNNNFDYYRHRDEGGSNKEHRRHKHRSRDRGGRFDKESLKGEGLPGAAQRPRQELRHRPLFFTDL